jgi:hypothetical protein
MLMADYQPNLATNAITCISVSPSSTSLAYIAIFYYHLKMFTSHSWFDMQELSYVAIFHHHLHMVFISDRWFYMQELVLHTISFTFGTGEWQTRLCYMRFYGLIGRRGMLAPPGQLIWYISRSVNPIIWFAFPTKFTRLLYLFMQIFIQIVDPLPLMDQSHLISG